MIRSPDTVTQKTPRMNSRALAKSKAAVGAQVLYRGHNATFVADIFEVAGAVVVRASGPIHALLTHGTQAARSATHQIVDFPERGFWRPELGILVVPTAQLRALELPAPPRCKYRDGGGRRCTREKGHIGAHHV